MLEQKSTVGGPGHSSINPGVCISAVSGYSNKRVKLLNPKECVLRVLFSPVHLPFEMSYVVLPRGVTAVAMLSTTAADTTVNQQNLNHQTQLPAAAVTTAVHIPYNRDDSQVVAAAASPHITNHEIKMCAAAVTTAIPTLNVSDENQAVLHRETKFSAIVTTTAHTPDASENSQVVASVVSQQNLNHQTKLPATAVSTPDKNEASSKLCTTVAPTAPASDENDAACANRAADVVNASILSTTLVEKVEIPLPLTCRKQHRSEFLDGRSTTAGGVATTIARAGVQSAKGDSAADSSQLPFTQLTQEGTSVTVSM
jgi:hypothetical protein